MNVLLENRELGSLVFDLGAVDGNRLGNMHRGRGLMRHLSHVDFCRLGYGDLCCGEVVKLRAVNGARLGDFNSGAHLERNLLEGK